MTWYIIKVDFHGNIRRIFESQKNLRDTLEDIPCPRFLGYFIFTDIKKLFLALVKKDKLAKVARRIGSSYEFLPRGYWDFISGCFSNDYEIWLDRPGEGTLCVDFSRRSVFLYGFGLAENQVRVSETLYKNLAKVFNLEDFYKVLREEGLEV